MKFNGLLATIFLLIGSLTFAGNDTCGDAPPESMSFNWCHCYSHYMEENCHALGGDDNQCQDNTIRQMIKEYGGPEIICQYFLNPNMDPGICTKSLMYYLNACPSQN